MSCEGLRKNNSPTSAQNDNSIYTSHQMDGIETTGSRGRGKINDAALGYLRRIETADSSRQVVASMEDNMRRKHLVKFICGITKQGDEDLT